MRKVNLWQAISQDAKAAKTFNEREIEVLQATEFFHLRTFHGSGHWTTRQVRSYRHALDHVGEFPRTMIYAASNAAGEMRCATVPAVLGEEASAYLTHLLNCVGTSMTESELVDLELVIEHETQVGEEDKGAILVKNLKDANVWLPKSLVQFELLSRRSRTYTVTLPLWLAEKRELV